MSLDIPNKILVCPVCKGSLGYQNEELICLDCNCRYKMYNGIPVMLATEDEKENSFHGLEDAKLHNIKLYSEYDKYFNDAGISRYAAFMNLGYIPNENAQYSKITDISNIVINKNSIKLLLEVIGAVDIEDKRIIDIGCGRGGNISTVMNFFKPLQIAGLDISIANIAFCKKMNRCKNVSFCVGDAENIPFTDESFDAVINIESSYAYPDRFHFYREVYRILAKGGYFMYADVLDKQVFAESEEYLKELGFDIIRSQDITSNIVPSCTESSRTRMESLSNVGDMQKLKNMLVAPGSSLYEMIIQGIQIYKIITLIKR